MAKKGGRVSMNQVIYTIWYRHDAGEELLCQFKRPPSRDIWDWFLALRRCFPGSDRFRLGVAKVGFHDTNRWLVPTFKEIREKLV